MKFLHLLSVLSLTLVLNGCVHKVITVPVKVAYKTTKGVVKGTVAVGKAIIPGDDNKKHKKD